MSGPKNMQGSPILLYQLPAMGLPSDCAKTLKRTSHKVSLYQTGETWNFVAIYNIFARAAFFSLGVTRLALWNIPN